MTKNLHSCPTCHHELSRINRTNFEKFLNKISFQNYYEKKYKCYSCLKEFSYGKGKSTPNISEDIQQNNFSTLKAGIPALIILLAIIGTMIVLSGVVNLESINTSFSFFSK